MLEKILLNFQYTVHFTNNLTIKIFKGFYEIVEEVFYLVLVRIPLQTSTGRRYSWRNSRAHPKMIRMPEKKLFESQKELLKNPRTNWNSRRNSKLNFKRIPEHIPEETRKGIRVEKSKTFCFSQLRSKSQVCSSLLVNFSEMLL